LGVTLDFLSSITDLTSLGGFSLSAITMSMGFIGGDVTGVLAGVILAMLGFFVMTGVFGGLFALLLGLMILIAGIITIFTFINDWQQNRL
jgi:uncharacterized membrane protein YphA (DoxX/SURF4 family)